MRRAGRRSQRKDASASIANTRSDELSIISIPKRAEVARLSIGNGPKHITVARIPKAVIAAFKSASVGAATH